MKEKLLLCRKCGYYPLKKEEPTKRWEVIKDYVLYRCPQCGRGYFVYLPSLPNEDKKKP